MPRARCVWRRATRAHDVVVGDGSLTFCTDGTGTYMLDDVTGARSEGSAERLRRTMRLFDALPEVDYAWPSISARDLDPLTAGLEIEAISLAYFSKHLQDEVREPGARGAAASRSSRRWPAARCGTGPSSRRSTAPWRRCSTSAR